MKKTILLSLLITLTYGQAAFGMNKAYSLPDEVITYGVLLFMTSPELLNTISLVDKRLNGCVEAHFTKKNTVTITINQALLDNANSASTFFRKKLFQLLECGGTVVLEKSVRVVKNPKTTSKKRSLLFAALESVVDTFNQCDEQNGKKQVDPKNYRIVQAKFSKENKNQLLKIFFKILDFPHSKNQKDYMKKRDFTLDLECLLISQNPPTPNDEYISYSWINRRDKTLTNS